ncbi:MAG: hypothetical protein DBY36_04820 [Clostridiales bacterium]|nr:MAG: hypothetical protein DBY36_04820 [Clostridiales bacterium]
MAKKQALIVWGGWDGHEPDKVAARFQRILENEGLEVCVSDTLDAFADAERLMGLHLIVPIWTGGNLSGELCRNVGRAVAAGTGLAGNHGGMCDAFRENVEWQFMTGANWVSHPGGIIDYTVEIRRNSSSPIVEGIEDFHVCSEQYYLHVDPAIEILATTRFPQATYYHSANKAIDMPVVWTKKWGHGRVFYSSLGHTDNVFDDSPASEEIMRRGMLWAIEGKDIAVERGLDPSVFENSAKMF